MTFPARSKTAIVGESGSGKSTAVGLITGALRADSGEVRIGGDEISTLNRNAYYAALAVVSSNNYIFNMTVRENFLLIHQTIGIRTCPMKTDWFGYLSFYRIPAHKAALSAISPAMQTAKPESTAFQSARLSGLFILLRFSQKSKAWLQAANHSLSIHSLIVSFL